MGKEIGQELNTKQASQLTQFLKQNAVTDLQGEKIVWEDSFREKLKIKIETLLKDDSVAAAAAFLAVRSCHNCFDVSNRDYVDSFLKSGKLHSDDVLCGPKRDSLLMHLLKESELDSSLVLHVLKTGPSLNPKLVNADGHTAFSIFVDRVITSAYFDRFINGSSNAEFHPFIHDLVAIFEALLSAGFFSVYNVEQQWRIVDHVDSAIKSWSSFYLALNDSRSIKRHVDELRVMDGIVHSEEEYRRQRRTAKCFAEAMTQEAVQRERKCKLIVGLMQNIQNNLKLRALANEKAATVAAAQRVRDLATDPLLTILLFGGWVALHLVIETSVLCDGTIFNDSICPTVVDCVVIIMFATSILAFLVRIGGISLKLLAVGAVLSFAVFELVFHVRLLWSPSTWNQSRPVQLLRIMSGSVDLMVAVLCFVFVFENYPLLYRKSPKKL